MDEEKAAAASSTRLVQTEVSSDRPPVMSRPKASWRRRIYFDQSLQFEAKAHRETIPTEREEEAIRLHQNLLLDRFQGADSRGQVFLSFSADRIELILRGISGVEAPAVGLALTPEK